MSESTESDDDVCNICLEGFQNKNYVKTDHPDDTSIKCCVDCIRKHMEINGNGLISRKPIKSYTIYNHNGEIVKKVDVEQKKQIQKIGDGEVLMSILQDIENENKRIDEKWRKRKRTNAIFSISLFLGFLLLFVIVKVGFFSGDNSFIPLIFLFIAPAFACMGLIIHGIMGCCGEIEKI